MIIEQVQHEILEAPVTVYNFEVEDYHTYYVSGSAILVHNANCGKQATPKSNPDQFTKCVETKDIKIEMGICGK